MAGRVMESYNEKKDEIKISRGGGRRQVREMKNNHYNKLNVYHQ